MKHETVVLGFDPGSRKLGIGAVRQAKENPFFIFAETAHFKTKSEPHALSEIRKRAERVIQDVRPTAVAVEKLFFSKNTKTGLQVMQARGVILEVAHSYRIPVFEFTPNEVKFSVAGYGGADKKAVAKMVNLILRTPDLKLEDDASDALAIALTGLGRIVLEEKTERKN